MNVGVVAAVVADQGIDNRLRLLGGRGVVEIDQRLAVYCWGEYRKVTADRRFVVHSALLGSEDVNIVPFNFDLISFYRENRRQRAYPAGSKVESGAVQRAL